MIFTAPMPYFKQLGHTLPANPELLDATSAFLGGTLFKGMTCSAFTAGVMAIGLKIGEIENSYPRVMRMLALMVSDGDPFEEQCEQIQPVDECRSPPVEGDFAENLAVHNARPSPSVISLPRQASRNTSPAMGLPGAAGSPKWWQNR